ncbi:MAG: radical SAM protein [Gammaproteobacteria bacterium]|nr:MAG: radical SAM protein [Gammaproteobacteria bacterium]
MNWLDAISDVEELEDAELDHQLIQKFQARSSSVIERPIRFSTPTFKEYSSTELKGCSSNSFPAFSITGAGCALNCDHCQTKILEPMIPVIKPHDLDRLVRSMIMMQNLQGFLLSGGSNKKNEINYGRYYPVLEKLKTDFPHLKIAIHTALTDEHSAKQMESAGVDTAMMDVIGAQETITEVYHLNRSVDDFEATLAALTSTKMEISPHIVIGLHYGKLLGEANALDIISRYDIAALVLVVIMPFYSKPGTFVTPATRDVGEIFLQSRKRLGDKQILLGCARPAGMHKRITDTYAVMAGLDGIAFPADGIAQVAGAIGRPFTQAHACCSIKTGDVKSGAMKTPCSA